MGKGYAIIPMDEYLKMHDELKILNQSCESLTKIAEENEKENEWLVEQIQRLKIMLEKCDDEMFGGE
jgi:hypothetical protein